MKLGLILECQMSGPDEAVYTTFIRRLCQEGEIGQVETKPICLNSFPDLIANCADSVSSFIDEGMDHVLICWDLYPSHTRNLPNCEIQRQDVLHELKREGIDLSRVTPICIQRELEAWLVCDGSSIKSLYRGAGNPPNIGNCLNPDKHPKPKEFLDNTFRTKLGIYEGYKPHIHAKMLAERANLKRCAKSQSFVRLVCKLKRLAPGKVKTSIIKCP